MHDDPHWRFVVSAYFSKHDSTTIRPIDRYWDSGMPNSIDSRADLTY
jgi:hypothetical protein